MTYTYHYASPLGGITLASDGRHLTGLWFDGQKYYADRLDPEHEELGIGQKVCRQGKIVLNVLFGQNRHPGGHGAYQRDLDHLPAYQAEGVIQNLNGPGFGRVPAYVSVFFQGL